MKWRVSMRMRFIILCILPFLSLSFGQDIYYRTYILGGGSSLHVATTEGRFLFAGIKGTVNENCTLGEQSSYYSDDKNAPSQGRLECGNKLNARFSAGGLNEIMWQNKSIAPTFSEFAVRQQSFTHTLRKGISLTLTGLCSTNPSIQNVFNQVYGVKYQCNTMPRIFQSLAKNILGNDFERDEQYDAHLFHQISYFDKDTIVVEESNYLYTGGAHGMGERSLRTFKIGGNEVNYYMMLEPAKIPALRERLWQEVQKYGDSVLTDFSSFQVTKNIAPGYTGMVFMYQSYEILPYSFGFPVLRLDFKEMMRYLDSRADLS